jgi:hypothetical protein
VLALNGLGDLGAVPEPRGTGERRVSTQLALQRAWASGFAMGGRLAPYGLVFLAGLLLGPTAGGERWLLNAGVDLEGLAAQLSRELGRDEIRELARSWRPLATAATAQEATPRFLEAAAGGLNPVTVRDADGGYVLMVPDPAPPGR